MVKRTEKLKREQEILKKNKLERKKRKRIEREIKGIYIGENLSLLKGCNRRVLRIIYDEIKTPDDLLNSIYSELKDYISSNYGDIKEWISNKIESVIYGLKATNKIAVKDCK